MKSKAIIPLVVGLAVGLVAIKLGLDVVKRAQGANRGAGAVQVVAASKTIPLASAITEHMIKTIRTSKEMTPEGAFADVADVIGRVSRSEIPKGVPVLDSMLAPPGSSPGMPSRIPDGYRAVSVKVDEASQVAGFLNPGCRVDVAAVMTIRRNRQTETISKVILQNIEVGAVGQSLTGDETGANVSRSVTLFVRASDVAKLNLASLKGKIQLAMRNQRDGGEGILAETTEAQLLAGDDPGSTTESSLLGGLLHGLAQSLKAPGQEERQIAPATGPWVVEICRDGQFEAVAFRNVDSMDRLSFGGADDLITRGTPRSNRRVGQLNTISSGGDRHE